MYAVFKTGGKQYRVIEGQIIYIERLDFNIGYQVEFDEVLLIRNENLLKIGNPFVKGGKIIAEILAHNLNQKIKIIKFRRRKHFCKHQGHRQHLTRIKIVQISSDIQNIRNKKNGT